MKKLQPLLLSCLFLVGAPLYSHADVVINSDFDAGYTTGDLTGQSGTDDTGFSEAYEAPSPDESSGSTTDEATQTVVAGGLTYAAGNVVVSGGTQSAQIVSANGDVFNALTRDFTSALTGQTYYERLVLNVPSTSQLGDLQFQLGGTLSTLSSAQVGAQDGDIEAKGPDDSQTSPALTLAAGNNLLVAEFVYNTTTDMYSTVNLFLDPTTTTQGTPDATVATSGTSLGSGLTLLLANNEGTYNVDSFAVGTTYGDVVTAPEPSSVALLLAGGLGLTVLALRRKLA